MINQIDDLNNHRAAEGLALKVTEGDRKREY